MRNKKWLHTVLHKTNIGDPAVSGFFPASCNIAPLLAKFFFEYIFWIVPSVELQKIRSTFDIKNYGFKVWWWLDQISDN